jgi:hypothetical protein
VILKTMKDFDFNVEIRGEKTDIKVKAKYLTLSEMQECLKFDDNGDAKYDKDLFLRLSIQSIEGLTNEEGKVINSIDDLIKESDPEASLIYSDITIKVFEAHTKINKKN